MMIVATILLSIAITTLIWCMINIITDNKYWFITLIIGGTLSFVGVGILYDTPTNNDVKEGTAHYVEQNHIEVVNGDTINTYKTYKIEWIENSK
jgi:hypothetical protein